MGRRWFSPRASVALALVLTTTGLVSAGTPASAEVAQKLPDLEQVPPYSILAYKTRQAGPKRLRLVFGAASQNVGRGRLVVVGHRPSRATRLMTADQAIETTDPATTQSVPRVGVLRYTRSPDHSHWHFLDFMRYELLRASNFRRVGRDYKTGFCLGDRYMVGVFGLREARATAAPEEPSGFDTECGLGRPDLLTLREGISPRYGDDYHPGLEGQLIDITALHSGRYVLVHRTNATRRIRESNYANNVASALLYISIDRSGRRGPLVRVLKSCRYVARCR